MVSFTALIWKEEEQFVALCPEIDVASQGYTIEEALANLKEAVELYLEEMDMPDTAKKRDMIIVKFDVKTVGKITKAVR